jgi:hypothetical protein
METGRVVQSFIDRENSGSESMVVPNHIRQLVLFMTRQGLEFLVDQDTPDERRRKFIDKTIKANKLDMYYQGIASLFIATGGVLWLMQPTLEGYSIYWFHSGKENNSIDDVKSQYMVFYSANGREMQEVVVRYKYYDRSSNSMYMNQSAVGQERWVRLRIKTDTVTQEFFNAEPPLDIHNFSGGYAPPLQTNSFINTLGYIPCVESPNLPYFPGDSGRSDFAMVSDQIEAEDTVRGAIMQNIFTFGNPTLITTRSRDEVMERVTDVGTQSWAASQGFNDISSVRLNDRRNDGGWAAKQHSKITSVIGNVGADERFGYVLPDPVSPDQSRFADSYRTALHGALGGIDPSDQSFSTFGEVKSLYGKVAATANMKSLTLWGHGLSRILELCVMHEERLFMEQFKQWLVSIDPKIDITQVNQSQIEQLIWGDNIEHPIQVGLAPYGEVGISYRYNGDIFEDSPDDKLKRTIYTRNLQELGVGSLEALDAVFPDLSLKEKKAKLSGIPFRVGNEYLGIMNNLMQMHVQMTQVEDPFNAGKALSMRYDMTKLMDSVYTVLSREFSYGASYDEADNKDNPLINGTSTPSILSGSSSPITSGTSASGNPTVAVSTATGEPLPFDWANPPVLPSSAIRTDTRGLGSDYSSDGSGIPTSQPSSGISGTQLGSNQLFTKPSFSTTTVFPSLPSAPVQPEARPKRSKRKG